MERKQLIDMANMRTKAWVAKVGMVRGTESTPLTPVELMGATWGKAGYAFRFDKWVSGKNHVSDTALKLVETELAAMKPDALLINTARGGLVDEAALADALRARRIGGAGFDVLTEEPPVANPLLAADILDAGNFILTPHVAWSGRAAMQTLAGQVIDNLDAFVRGQPVNRVA